MAFMQITVLPMETGKTSLSDYIADIQELLQGKDVDYEINDMGTIINGTPSALFRLAEELHACPFQHGVKRVITQIVIDERRDKKQGLGEKKGAVLSILTKRKR
ncbi:MTH1187 family thiamine-binding protein [Desulfobulbus sp. US2]|nr:MTH1187 family thiamine-binding protein [Desulfobulbus sp. US4]MCW5208250.1 MTH1187 family thiamine-binding protein [Desulfobulbus sp. US2]MCW5214793.1 MTH1187 family thiamine-binding protein [Desulfobulbus sp. US5]WLE95856.1 MAG: MTH1187 family thiamine-binding protein [Candidatus Electrothrix communis]